MNEVFSSPFFGISLSIFAFWIGVRLQARLKSVICNPLLIATLLVVLTLAILRIPYECYEKGGSIINMFLAPATACLAVSIYTRIQVLKENAIPILVGCTVGSLASMGSVYLLCRLFHLDEAMTAALLPKSVTTPIAIDVSASHGGIVPVTVIAVIITGITGNVLAPFLIRLFRIKNPIVSGLSIGACSHALGTSKALEIGETEGAMSGLAIGICGLVTVIVSIFL